MEHLNLDRIQHQMRLAKMLEVTLERLFWLVQASSYTRKDMALEERKKGDSSLILHLPARETQEKEAKHAT